jgi:tRNA-splicing ligase RtcB (3'-phosphate/5'-hydroxy nucleic acid ligase)
MDISQLVQLSDYCWAAKTSPDKIQLFASKSLLETMDEKVLQQLANVAKLPGLISAAMAMPDAHWGYGFPIGGVAAFDPDEGGIISAGGVGFDISCGIRCLASNLSQDEILPHAQKLSERLFKIIPAGVGAGGKLRLTTEELDEVLVTGAKWAIANGFGRQEDLEYIEEEGQMEGAIPANVSDTAKNRQRVEMGTLGSGNHYLEVQVVKEIYDQQAATAYGLFENQVIISIHCGSRGLGHQIGTDYLVSLAKKASQLGIQLPDRELACAPINSPEGQQYIGAMNSGINCALANRQILTHLARLAFADVIPNAELKTFYDVSHNTCKKESYSINGCNKLLYIHRKGATRAFGPNHPSLPKRYAAVGQPVVIGGSMGTASYILAGNSSELNPAFSSASHGAGRAMSRHQASKHWRGKELINELNSRGIIIRSRSMRGISEEAPKAYKDVNEVALVTEQAGLARRVALLVPKICIKG